MIKDSTVHSATPVRGPIGRHIALLRRFASGAALVGTSVLSVACGKSAHGASGSAGATISKIGDVVGFEDSDWSVVSVKNLGNKLKPGNPFGEPKSTAGQFIEVQYKVTNKQSQQDSIVDGPKLLDAKGRQFGHIEGEGLMLASGQKSIVLENLQPSMPAEFWTIYEVPSDATGLQFQARSLGAMPSYKTVDLGALPAAVAAGPMTIKIDQLGLKGMAPGETEEPLMGHGDPVMINAAGFSVNVAVAKSRDPKTLKDGQSAASLFKPKNAKPETLADGWALTYENTGSAGTNYFVTSRRQIGGKGYLCETVQSTPEQQKAALAFCKSLTTS